MTAQEHFKSLEPILDTLKEIPHLAWKDLVCWIPESALATIFPIPRAAFVQWRMIEHAQNAFGTNGRIRVVNDHDGLHFLYVSDDQNPVACEFGKADESLCRTKNQNAKNRLCLEQMSLWHYDTEPARFNLVYTVGGYGLSAHIDRVALTMEGTDGVMWEKVLSKYDEDQGGDFVPPVRPVDPNDGPAPPQVVPKSPVKDGEQNRQTRIGDAG